MTVSLGATEPAQAEPFNDCPAFYDEHAHAHDPGSAPAPSAIS